MTDPPFRLTRGDAFELIRDMPNHSVDLIVTDPPYDSEFHGGGLAGEREKFRAIGKSVGSTSKFAIDPILPELYRVCRPFNAYLWCSRGQVPTYLDFGRERGLTFEILTWCKINPMPLTNNRLIGAEYCVFLREKKATFNNGLPLDNYLRYYIAYRNEGTGKHPTEKPLELMKRHIRISSMEQDTVFDPFAGSGTTGIAALSLRRRFVGFELREDYHALATYRLASARPQNTLLEAEACKP